MSYFMSIIDLYIVYHVNLLYIWIYLDVHVYVYHLYYCSWAETLKLLTAHHFKNRICHNDMKVIIKKKKKNLTHVFFFRRSRWKFLSALIGVFFFLLRGDNFCIILVHVNPCIIPFPHISLTPIVNLAWLNGIWGITKQFVKVYVETWEHGAIKINPSSLQFDFLFCWYIVLWRISYLFNLFVICLMKYTFRVVIVQRSESVCLNY